MSELSESDALLERARRMFDGIPHSRVLGLEVVSCEQKELVAKLPYRAEIVGNPHLGYIHSGALTTLVDQASGTVVMLAMDRPRAVATLDLRVDHLRPARPDKTLYAQAVCYRLTRSVAFVRCVCYEDDPDDPVATSMSTFMCG